MEVEISVCICTFKREASLWKCLYSIYKQSLKRQIEIVIIDNDTKESGKKTYQNWIRPFKRKNIILKYFLENKQGISSARNRCISESNGKYICFIDDDEEADPEWLVNLRDCIINNKADGVFGPVVPRFGKKTPKWIKPLFRDKKSKSEKKVYSITGFECANNNLIIHKEVLLKRTGPYDIKFNQLGGEDMDLFTWLVDAHKCKFLKCETAIVFEYQNYKRCKSVWIIKRSYRGGWLNSSYYVKRDGYIIGIIILTIRIYFSLIQSTFMALFITNTADARTGFLYFLRSLFSNIGRIGYFLKANYYE